MDKEDLVQKLKQIKKCIEFNELGVAEKTTDDLIQKFSEKQKDVASDYIDELLTNLH